MEDGSRGLRVILGMIYSWFYSGMELTEWRYNMSYIVQQSVSIGKPIIGVSINYRMAAFGFIDSQEIAAEGSQNLGLRDQRVALQWVNLYM